MSYTKKKTYEKKEPVVRTPFVPAFPPSPEQEAIFGFLKLDFDSLHVSAVAGSGKSTTLKWLMSMDKRTPSKFMAFNKEIVEAIEPECPYNVDISTAHAAGNRSLGAALRTRLFTSKNKVEKILKENWPKLFDPDKFTGKEKGIVLSRLFDTRDLISKMKLTLTNEDDHEGIVGLMIRFNIDIDKPQDVIPLLPTIFEKILEVPSVIDFDDMMWIPIRLGLPIPQFEKVYIDEVQDFNNLLIEYASRMIKEGGRAFTVGDRRQCQPAGNMILMGDGKWIDIKDVNVGNTVLSYDKRSSQFNRSKRVLAKQARDYNGLIYKISINNHSSTCTPNHKWFVKWSSEFASKYIVYLMKKGNQFRIGKCKAGYKCGGFGPGMRARQENADAAWILSMCNSDEEACLQEKIYSYRFNIPTLMFNDPMGSRGHCNQTHLDLFWNEVGDNSEKGIKALEFFDLIKEYPLWSKGQTNYMGINNGTFECQACNLLEGYMMIPYVSEHYDWTHRGIKKWCKISVEKEEFSGKVYSLNVEDNKNYTSNNMLTCNSIYGFAGANSSSIDVLKGRFNSQELPLNTCYRCGKSIIELAQTIVPEIQAFEGNEDGEVNHPDKLSFDMPDGSMILSRRNANLVKPCFELIRQGRKAIIKGKDIGLNLVKVINKHKGNSLDETLDKIEVYTEQRVEKLRERQTPPASSIDALTDTYDVIKYIAEDCKTTEEMVSRIENIFDEKTKGITLSSIHRSKGLEADHVTIVDYARVRLSNERMTQEDHMQEANLNYVAVTRAKKKLDLIL